jgi:Family of unknown function (DUF6399)
VVQPNPLNVGCYRLVAEVTALPDGEADNGWTVLATTVSTKGCLDAEILAAYQEHAQAFQRASSAVAGRNGSWSQRHHTHRGLPQSRYQVWTVLPNFACRASEGTTPASRFCRRDFPDLFETVLSPIEELPRPRRRNQTIALSA